MVDAGVGPEEHFAQALKVDHPFANDPPIKRDLRFAVKAWARIEPNIQAHRGFKIKVLQQLARGVRQMDDHALAQRHAGIEGAPGIRPVIAAMMVVLLK